LTAKLAFFSTGLVILTSNSASVPGSGQRDVVIAVLVALISLRSDSAWYLSSRLGRLSDA
jgi:hypothetical protein